jgi:hypothetical protein
MKPPLIIKTTPINKNRLCSNPVSGKIKTASGFGAELGNLTNSTELSMYSPKISGLPVGNGVGIIVGIKVVRTGVGEIFRRFSAALDPGSRLLFEAMDCAMNVPIPARSRKVKTIISDGLWRR